MTATRIASYARISQSRDESTSIARQREQAQAWAAMKGGTLVAEYEDDGISGAVPPQDRPGLAAAIAAAEAGQIDALVVAKLDRLARDVRAFLELADLLAKHDVALISIAESLDMGSAAGRMVATVLAAFASMERERTAERILESNRYLASVGAISGQAAPYGWVKDRKEDGRLRLDLHPDQAPRLRAVVDAVLNGTTVAEAARQAGIPLQRQSVMYLLRHPVLLGRHVYLGQVVTGTDGLPITPHEPLVDWAEWSALQAKLDAGAVPRSGSGRGGTDTLLGGTRLVECANCGGVMFVARRTVREIEKIAYRCRRGCGSAAAHEVDAIVEEQFLSAVGAFEVMTVTETIDESAELLEQARSRQAELSALVAEGLLPIDVARDNLATLQATITKLEAANTSGATTTTPTGMTFAEAWGDADTLARRDLLKSALDAVIISKATTHDRTSFDSRRVVVRWNT